MVPIEDSIGINSGPCGFHSHKSPSVQRKRLVRAKTFRGRKNGTHSTDAEAVTIVSSRLGRHLKQECTDKPAPLGSLWRGCEGHHLVAGLAICKMPNAQGCLPTHSRLRDRRRSHCSENAITASQLRQSRLPPRQYLKVDAYPENSLRNCGEARKYRKPTFGPVCKNANRASRMKFELNETLRGASDEELLEDLCQSAKSIGRDTITRAEYEKIGRGHPCTIHRRFGSWTNALKRAGLQPSRSKIGITDEELFDNLKSLWISLGRQPSYSEVKAPNSRFSSGTYENRFGSWSKARRSFIEWVNSGAED